MNRREGYLLEKKLNDLFCDEKIDEAFNLLKSSEHSFEHIRLAKTFIGEEELLKRGYDFKKLNQERLNSPKEQAYEIPDDLDVKDLLDEVFSDFIFLDSSKGYFNGYQKADNGKWVTCFDDYNKPILTYDKLEDLYLDIKKGKFRAFSNALPEDLEMRIDEIELEVAGVL